MQMLVKERFCAYMCHCCYIADSRDALWVFAQLVYCPLELQRYSSNSFHFLVDVMREMLDENKKSTITFPAAQIVFGIYSFFKYFFLTNVIG